MVRQFREPNLPSVANTICRLFLNCLHDSKSSIVSCLLEITCDTLKTNIRLAAVQTKNNYL